MNFLIGVYHSECLSTRVVATTNLHGNNRGVGGPRGCQLELELGEE
jgi:hypothetical protein